MLRTTDVRLSAGKFFRSSIAPLQMGSPFSEVRSAASSVASALAGLPTQTVRPHLHFRSSRLT